jgi:hypothetical protein
MIPEVVSFQGRGPCAKGWKGGWAWMRNLVMLMGNSPQSHDQTRVREYDKCYAGGRRMEETPGV